METTRRLAIFRINFKSDFVLTLQSDAGWNIPFCIKFWTSIPTRAYYAGWDGTTYTHCAPVAGDSSKLQVQFDNHNLPIGELKYQIGYHFTVDDFPNDPEDEVINQEDVIIDNNGRNEKVLLDFNGETAPDIQFSLPAYANEAQRIENEEQRIANEEQRIENEQTRVGNEETRIVHEWERQRNEQTRITQEEARERAFTQMQRDSESAISAANDAATLANSKARLAQEKAEYAQQQGDFAKAQGETAQLDHTKAAADHQTALADHQTAAADHQTAAADHQIAAADHQTAEADHTRAGQDHTDIQNAISAADLVYDISKAHASGGVLATYADLSAALGTNGANVPVERRQGGMTVQFVRTSDNSYVQYIFDNTDIANFTNVDCWVKDTNSLDVIDSSYLIDIDVDDITTYVYCILNTGIKWASNNRSMHKALPVSPGEKYYIEASGELNAKYAFLTEATGNAGENVTTYAPNTSLHSIPVYGRQVIIIPDGCKYLYLTEATASGTTVTTGFLPSKLSRVLDLGNIYNNCLLSFRLLGKGNEPCDSLIYNNIKAGHIYRIWIKNPDVAMTDVTLSTSSYYRFSVRSINASGVYTRLFKVDCSTIVNPASPIPLCDYYDITLPSDAVGLSISARCATGSELVCLLEDNTSLKSAEDSLEWQLEAQCSYCYLKPNESGTFGSNAGYSTWFNSVTSGELLKVELGADNCILCFSQLRPDVDVAFTDRKVLPAGVYYIKAPYNGYFSIYRQDALDAYVYKIRPNVTMLYKHKMVPNVTSAKALDLNVNSDTYAQMVAINTSNYGISEAIDISAYSYIGIFNTYTSASSFSAGNGSLGGLFFDANYTGDTNAAQCVVGEPLPVSRAATMNREVAFYKVPDGAKYVRVLINNTFNYMFGLDENESIDVDEVTEIAETVVAETLVNDAKTIGAKTIFELNPDTEMLAKMVIAKKKFDSGASGSGTIVPLVFAHISDAHGGAAQYQRYIEFANHWKDKNYIDELIDSGDVVSATYNDGASWRGSIEGIEDVLTVVGNHDTRCDSAEQSTASLSGFDIWNYHSSVSQDSSKRADAYNLLIKDYVSNWGVTQPSDAAANGLCYYYKDYASKGIRLIGLDVMGYNQDEQDWLVARLAEAKTLEYHVVILAHFTGTTMVPLNCNYTSLRNPGTFGGTYNQYLEQTNPDAIAEAVDAFQEDGGVFIGYIIGHYHRDMINIVSADYPKQLVFAVNSGGKTITRDFTKVSGCKSYDDFQIISINTEDKTVKLIKVGADTDYYMRKKGTISVGYTLVKDDGTEPDAGETATKVKGIIGEGW